jgi:hypothetical protein
MESGVVLIGTLQAILTCKTLKICLLFVDDDVPEKFPTLDLYHCFPGINDPRFLIGVDDADLSEKEWEAFMFGEDDMWSAAQGRRIKLQGEHIVSSTYNYPNGYVSCFTPEQGQSNECFTDTHIWETFEHIMPRIWIAIIFMPLQYHRSNINLRETIKVDDSSRITKGNLVRNHFSS